LFITSILYYYRFNDGQSEGGREEMQDAPRYKKQKETEYHEIIIKITTLSFYFSTT